jgi:hypothetical protein
VTVVLCCWDTTFESWLKTILFEISCHPESPPSEKRGNRPLWKRKWMAFLSTLLLTSMVTFAEVTLRNGFCKIK